MTRQNAAGVIPVRDPLPVAFEPLGPLATSVLDEHTDQAGVCGVGLGLARAWPCEPVVLAAHNLAVI
jgi:hypothetical protein